MADLILLAHVPTAAVNEGFLPAARRLGLRTVLLTDCWDDHLRQFAHSDALSRADEVIACDVFNPVAVIEAVVGRSQHPLAVFSNSDHLQTSAALAAQYLGLPGKDWRVTYRAKNKAAMRAYLCAQGVDMLWHAVLTGDTDLVAAAAQAPFPCVAKPREGVGSQLVKLVRDAAELADYCRAVWIEQPGRVLLLEEYVPGELHTLETLGDGRTMQTIGGFRVRLSEPPHFVELAAEWGDWLTADQKAAILDQLARFGVGFGSCHTEFVLTDTGPRLIEINYRTVGDRREFLLDEMLDFPLFETILRLHLGQPLGQLDPGKRVAAMRYYPTSQAGELVTAPDAFARTEGNLRWHYRPLRSAGDTVAVTHSNKDYLGVLSASAPDAAALAGVMRTAGAHLAWEIRL